MTRYLTSNLLDLSPMISIFSACKASREKSPKLSGEVIKIMKMVRND